ncbi:MAG: MarC family protein [Planctomyces sp.]|nr:MarC family protein [Planctomyces sp.]
MLQTILLLFIVLDPFGNLVMINSLLRDYAPSQRRWIMVRESLVALLILQLAVFAGGPVLQALGLKTYSLGIAGGIVLFMIAMGMIFPGKKLMDEEDSGDPVIVPIAIPLIAGPSTISLILLLAQKHDRSHVSVSVLVACALSTFILALSPRIYTLLGVRGARAVERLMGMLLVMMAVQMVLDGIQAYLKQ